MAVSTTVSLVLSSVFAVMLFSTMQLYRPWFVSSQWNTILCGYIGSWLFVLALTAISNLETIVLGHGFQAKLFPEICFCLVGTMFACGTIHRVSATTCLLFSIFALYFINKISQKAQNVAVPAVDAHASSKKKRK